MRVNVYAEEITGEVKVVEKDGFIGLRFYLASAPELHNTVNDDDRSAVTLWGASKSESLILAALRALELFKAERNIRP